MTNDDDTTPATPEAPRPASEAPRPSDAEPVAQEPVPVTYTEQELQARVEAATAEAKDRHLRLAAEYDNYRRRVAREREQWSAEAVERFVSDLLPVLDNFERALAVKADDPEAVLEGVRLTEKVMRAALGRHGVECIDPLGGKFDPRLHEAVTRGPRGDREAGTVLAVFERGYTLKGRLLRPARVQVAGDE